jgi:hypothetical protein
VDFNDAILSTTSIFYCVVVPEGFTRFELVEQEGAVGDEKYFSADSFTFATAADVTPPPPPPPPTDPTVDAGANQVATEGDGIVLRGSASGGDGSAIVSYLWEQVGGLAAPLSHPEAAETRLVAPPLAGVDADLRFRLTVTDANGGQGQDEVLVMVVENGISGYPADAYTFHSAYGDPMGLTLGTGVELVDLHEVDPANLAGTDTSAPPDQIPYGLFDFILKVDTPGASAEVIFWLPDTADPLADWFKYTPSGWQSLDTQVVFSAGGGCFLSLVRVR